MRKFLILLAMLFVTFLNIRVLFCQHDAKNLATEFNVYDAVVGIKNKLYCLMSPTTTNVQTNVVTGTTKTKKQQSIKELLDHDLNSSMVEFKASKAWGEMGVQQLMNLLDAEIKMVDSMINGMGGDSLQQLAKNRTMLLQQSAPTIKHVYEDILNVAAYHPKLKPVPVKDKKGKVMFKERALTSTEKKQYFKGMKKALEENYQHMRMVQGDMMIASGASRCQKTMMMAKQKMMTPVAVAVDAQQVQVKQAAKKAKKAARTMKTTKKTDKKQEMLKTCKMLKNTLEKHIQELSTTTSAQI